MNTSCFTVTADIKEFSFLDIKWRRTPQAVPANVKVMLLGKRPPPAATYANTARPCPVAAQGTSTTLPPPGYNYVTLIPMESPAAQCDENSLPAPSPTQDPSTFSDFHIPELQATSSCQETAPTQEKEVKEVNFLLKKRGSRAVLLLPTLPIRRRPGTSPSTGRSTAGV